jgi:hypothetical protein
MIMFIIIIITIYLLGLCQLTMSQFSSATLSWVIFCFSYTVSPVLSHIQNQYKIADLLLIIQIEAVTPIRFEFITKHSEQLYCVCGLNSSN